MSKKTGETAPKRKSSLFLTLKGLFYRSSDDMRSILEEEQMQSPFRTIVRNFRSNKIAMAGVIIFLLIFLSCIILPIFYPLDMVYQDPTQQNISPGFGMLNPPKELQGKAVQVSVGSTFAVALDTDGKVYQWGKLDAKLKKVPKFRGKIVQLAAGQSHVLALDDKGEVYTWGYNRMGLDTIPIDLRFETVKQIAAGPQISYALSQEGNLFVWGNENIVTVNPDDYQGRIAKVATNGTTLIGLLDDGTVAQLSNKNTPFSVIPEGLTDVIDVASTDKAVIALKEDGTVTVWGNGDYGILEIPADVQGNVAQVAAGASHFSVLLKDGTVRSWGRDNLHQANAPSVKNAVAVSADYYQSYSIDEDGNVKGWGLNGYLMGTDHYGRDVFTRLLTGGRMTMTIGAISVIISTIVGILVGGISGYYGGKLDNLLMRATEVVMSLPFLPFAMILSALVGNSVSETVRIALIMVILGLLSWPGLARLVRAQILSEREKEFVTAAKAMGIREKSIVFRHILPNVITVIIVNTTLAFASCMLIESSLSFLGFGVSEPRPTWGNMLTGAQSSQVIGTYWWRWVFPSLALGLSTISINSIGDGLRDAIDPRSNER